MKLYEINELIEEAFLTAVDEETGEINEAYKAILDELLMQKDEKIEGILLLYKNRLAEAKAIKAEEEILAKRRKTLENEANRLKAYAEYALEGEKFTTPKVAVSYRKSESVEVSDESLIPEEYFRIKKEIAKADIKSAIKAGTEVPGACIITTSNMQVK